MAEGLAPVSAKSWQQRIAYPILLFILLESLAYILIRGYKLQGEIIPFTVILALAIAITQIRLITGVYVSNLLIGPITIVYFLHQRFFILQDLRETAWLRLLYLELKKGLGYILTRQFRNIGELTLTFLIMIGVWTFVHFALKRLIYKQKIMGLLISGFVIQGIVYSYQLRVTTGANFAFTLAGLLLLSLVRLSKLETRWQRQNMSGVEDLGIKWIFGATLLVFSVVLISSFFPAVGSRVSVQNSRLQTIFTLLGGTKPMQGGIQGSGGGGDVPPEKLNPNNTFQLDTQQLGGPWFGNNTLVMSVTSSLPAYWRGAAKDVYDGRQWKTANKNLDTYQSLVYQGIKTQQLEQKVKLGAGFSSQVAFGAAMIRQVDGLQSQYSWDNNGTVLLTGEDLKSGTTYTVASLIPVLDDESIKVLRTSGGDYPQKIKEEYLNLPVIPERVRDLALRITGVENNPYDKALALQNYFQANEEFTYNLKPQPVPAGRDFVDYFLFDSKQGYCTYFSTAMAVMARCAGLPSRWVIGYTSGSSNEKTPDVYRVSEMNKHAWVEIYFAGVGWIPFEPTKSFSLPSASAYSSKATEQTPQPSNNLPQNMPNAKVYYYKLISALAIAALILACCVVYWFKRNKVQGPPDLVTAIRKRRSNRQLILTAYLSFLKLMQKIGFARSASQTPREFARARQSELAEHISYITQLTEAFEQARYSKFVPSDEEAELAQANLRLIREKVRDDTRTKNQ